MRFLSNYTCFCLFTCFFPSLDVLNIFKRSIWLYFLTLCIGSSIFFRFYFLSLYVFVSFALFLSQFIIWFSNFQFLINFILFFSLCLIIYCVPLTHYFCTKILLPVFSTSLYNLTNLFLFLSLSFILTHLQCTFQTYHFHTHSIPVTFCMCVFSLFTLHFSITFTLYMCVFSLFTFLCFHPFYFLHVCFLSLYISFCHPHKFLFVCISSLFTFHFVIPISFCLFFFNLHFVSPSLFSSLSVMAENGHTCRKKSRFSQVFDASVIWGWINWSSLYPWRLYGLFTLLSNVKYVFHILFYIF